MPTSFIQTNVEAPWTKTPGNSVGSREDSLIIGGKRQTVLKNVVGNGATFLNLFKVQGIVEILKIQGIVKNVTNSNVLQTVYFDLWDGNGAKEITDNTGVDCSGAIVNGYIGRNAVNTVPASFFNGASGVIEEVTSPPFRVHQKNGVDTLIRFCFTGDANTNLQLEFSAIYKPISGGAQLSNV